MAPRKKRNTKAKNAKNKANEKVASKQDTEPIPEKSKPTEKLASESNLETDTAPSQRTSPRQHKKFGKFRFLIEESQKLVVPPPLMILMLHIILIA